MKRYIVLLILFSLLILPNSSHNTPFWSQEKTFPTSSNTYVPDGDYSFEINWTDSIQGIGGVSSVIFENNFLGQQNYTKDTTPTVLNNTNGIYWINFTDLSAGTYYYKWYANDTSNNFNSTNQFSYTIEKNDFSIVLSLNWTLGNRSYKIGDTAAFQVLLGHDGFRYLDSSYPGWVLQSSQNAINNITNLTENGIFSLTAYWNGNENYTSSSVTYYFDTLPPRYYNPFLTPTNPTSYAPNQTYKFNITWDDIDLDFVYFESNHTEDMENYTYPDVQNQSGNFWIELLDLPAETFVYRWISADSANNVNSTTPITYTIQKANALVLSAPTSASVEEMVTVICYSTTNQITYEDFDFYRDDTVIPNISLLSRFESPILEVGTYDYVCNTTGNENYSSQSISRSIEVVEGGESEGDQPKEEFEILQLTRPTIQFGTTGQSTFNLSNTYDETLIDIEVEINGIPEDWYTIEGVPSALLKGGSVKITIKFDIPDDADVGEYDLTVDVSAVIEGGSGTRTATESITLTVTAEPPVENEPPSYYSSFFNNTVAGEPTTFALEWVDDFGLGDCIFSTNNSGEWVNDSEKNLVGRSYTCSAEKTLNSQIGAVIAWKFYASDEDAMWVASEQFDLITTKEQAGGIDILTIVIVIVVVIAIIGAIFLLRSKLSKEVEHVIEYYYRREDAGT